MNDKLGKLDIYRISDPIFRLHSRLYRVQAAIARVGLSNIKAAKINSYGMAGFLFIFVVSLITVLTTYFEIKGMPIVILGILLAGVVVMAILNIRSISSSEKEFSKLVEESGAYDIETWVDYTKSLVAAWGTRLKMINEALEENEKLHEAGVIAEEKHRKQSEYLNEIRSQCMSELDDLDEKNRLLHDEKKRTDEDFDKINEYIHVAKLDI
jgi:uncharacterized membrane protein